MSPANRPAIICATAPRRVPVAYWTIITLIMIITWNIIIEWNMKYILNTMTSFIITYPLYLTGIFWQSCGEGTRGILLQIKPPNILKQQNHHCSNWTLIFTCLMMALNDIPLSRAVRASPDTEKQNVRRNPAIPANMDNAINKDDHTLPSSSAVRGSANTFGNNNNNYYSSANDLVP